jgi:hypothetical protein
MPYYHKDQKAPEDVDEINVAQCSPNKIPRYGAKVEGAPQI